MGDSNQFKFVQKFQERLSGPFLEVGSRDYGSTQNLRSLFHGETYVGLDLSEGSGVDVVMDLTQPFDVLDKMLGHQRFGTIFSLSVMEHCENPFLMADNMTRLLKPGGRIILSVPFAWKFHGYPSDYWRFTGEGVKKLFPGLNWEAEGPGWWHSSKHEGFCILDESVGIAPLSGKYYRKRGQMLRGFGADFLKIPRFLGLFQWLLRYRYMLVPSMIDMIGVLPERGEESD